MRTEPVASAVLSVAVAVAGNQILNAGVWNWWSAVIAVALSTLSALVTSRLTQNAPNATWGELSIRGLLTLARKGPATRRSCLRLLAVLVAVLTPASSAVTMAEEAGSEAPPEKPRQASAVSPHTADPCLLVEATALGKFGRTEIDRNYGNFDRCDVLIYPHNDHKVDVKVEFAPGPLPEQTTSTRTVRGIVVVEEAPQGRECERRLAPSWTDDLIVTVTAKRSRNGRASLCDVADVATETAAAKLDERVLEKQPRVLPPASLAHRDACALLGPDDLGRFVTGVDARNPEVAFGNWSCRWASTTGDLWVDLHFDQGQLSDATEGTPVGLNGYRAFVNRWADGERACLTRVLYRSYTRESGGEVAETLWVLADGSLPMDRLCRTSTELARSATARLRQLSR
ncbi:hypothetical protein [Streptosporangium saharense]|uniref:hypothetical protein n=1 Tax=Streptosporangium saharense TaxID=1706840 RepID=UPI00343C5D41